MTAEIPKSQDKAKAAAPSGAGLRVLLSSTAMIVVGGLFSAWLIAQSRAPLHPAATESQPPVAQALVDVPPQSIPMDLEPPLEVAQQPEPASPSEPPVVGPPRRLTVATGDTLSALLSRAPLPETDRRAVVTALESVFDARRLRPGQELQLVWSGAAVSPRLERLTLIVENNDRVVVRATASGFEAERPALAQRIAPPEPQVEATPQPEPRPNFLGFTEPTNSRFLDPSVDREDR